MIELDIWSGLDSRNKTTRSTFHSHISNIDSNDYIISHVGTKSNQSDDMPADGDYPNIHLAYCMKQIYIGLWFDIIPQ